MMDYFDGLVASKLFGGGDSPVPPTPTPSSDELYDVMFYDYDGTVLHHYTKNEFLALSTMPENPTHEGLTSQGWNWTLADAKEYVTNYDVLDIGQHYITSDGATTKLVIELREGIGKTFHLNWYQSASNGVTVNWGDGSAEETASATGEKQKSHEYAEYGNYTVSLTPASGVTFGPTYYGFCYDDISRLSVKQLFIGIIQHDPSYCFMNLYCVEASSIPNNLGYIDISTCRSIKHITVPSSSYINMDRCYNLKSVSMPKMVYFLGSLYNRDTKLHRFCFQVSSGGGIPSQVLANSRNLKTVVIPEGKKTVNQQAFQECYSLESITLPSTTTTIGAQSFSNCVSLREVHVLATTPPTMSNSNSFSLQMPTVFYVPTSSVGDYKSASNWSVYADRIVGE